MKKENYDNFKYTRLRQPRMLMEITLDEISQVLRISIGRLSLLERGIITTGILNASKRLRLQRYIVSLEKKCKRVKEYATYA